MPGRPFLCARLAPLTLCVIISFNMTCVFFLFPLLLLGGTVPRNQRFCCS